MYQKAVALWHGLSAAEKGEWESQARPKHMTGFAWFMSQALKPNPGLYLPLQGGTMQGIIEMDGWPVRNMLDPVNPQDADTEAARDAAIAAAIGGSLTCDIYGYDGSNWQKLLVESAAQHNLRVRLYAGANAIDTHSGLGHVTTVMYGLVTRAIVCGYDGTDFPRVYARAGNADNESTAHTGLVTNARLFGYDGEAWDRLRTWSTGVLKIGRAEVDSTTIRKTAAGAVVGGAHRLFWVACSPDAPAAEWELTDAVGGGQPVVYDHFDNDRHSEQLIFDPPMKFTTGIWIEKFDHMKSLTFCYT
ncbi:hypothetical protein ES703_56202 [subsurface metagenome]